MEAPGEVVKVKMTKMSVKTRWLEDFTFPVTPLILELVENDLNPFLVNVPILYPWKHQKVLCLLVFSGVKKWERKPEMG